LSCGRVCGYDFVLTCPSPEGESGFTGDGKPVTGADQGEQGDGEPADGGLSGAGESVTGADLGEQGVSAGGTATGFSGAGGSPPKKTILKKTIKKTKHSPSESAAPASRTRGTRIPASFTVTDAMRAWAVADATKVRQSPPDLATFADWLDRHTQQFCDHWTGKNGSDAVKLDWVATWRKWIRTEIDKVAQRSNYPGAALAITGQQPARMSTGDRRLLEAQAALRAVKEEMA
jgi:hypothetical protein